MFDISPMLKQPFGTSFATAINANKKPMSYSEVLSSEYSSIARAIEHGSSDPEVIKKLKKELLDKTGYKYV